MNIPIAAGGMLLNIAADMDHEARVDEVITLLNNKVRAGEDPNEWLGWALNKACLDEFDITDDDAERIMRDVRYFG